MHIAIVNNYAGYGGIPKFVAMLANGMAERGHMISIISQKPVTKRLFPLYCVAHWFNKMSTAQGQRPPLRRGKDWLPDIYPLRKEIRVIPYSFTDKNLDIQQTRIMLQKLEPDVCIVPLADAGHLVWAVTLLGTGIPYIYSERTSPYAIENEFWCRKGRLAAMSGADRIHLLLPSYAATVPDFLRKRVSIIPNAVKLPHDMANVAKTGAKTFLWLGRLFEEAKQCKLAIDAFAQICCKFPEWKMRIVGDGPDSGMIRKYATKYRIPIEFAGASSDVATEYLSAQAFCLSSRIEGMPNALLEAMAAGLPCVAFQDCQGVSEIISSGQNGLLATEMTAKSLASGMAALMSHVCLRKRLGAAAKASASEYAEASIMDAWENLVHEAAAEKGDTALDAFNREPFASMARMSSRARAEWALRDFMCPMPDSMELKLWRIYSRVKRPWVKMAAAIRRIAGAGCA